MSFELNTHMSGTSLDQNDLIIFVKNIYIYIYIYIY